MGISKAKIDVLNTSTTKSNIEISMLRLDLLHTQISGNKGYKLLYNLENVLSQNKKGIVTFGGAYSNHLHATAYTCNKLGLKSIGIVRGDEVDNGTLQDCIKWGMQLSFYPRNLFKKENENRFHTQIKNKFVDYYLVPMGGDNELGIQGASNIYTLNNLENYTHIICSVGTGTTLLGIINASNVTQKIIGICAVKDKHIETHFNKFANKNNYTLLQNYSQAGFGKTTNTQIQFILDFYKKNNIVLDIIYNSKMMMAVEDLIAKNFFTENVKILCIHSGGIQGNRSVKELQNLTKE